MKNWVTSWAAKHLKYHEVWTHRDLVSQPCVSLHPSCANENHVKWFGRISRKQEFGLSPLPTGFPPSKALIKSQDILTPVLTVVTTCTSLLGNGSAVLNSEVGICFFVAPVNGCMMNFSSKIYHDIKWLSRLKKIILTIPTLLNLDHVP